MQRTMYNIAMAFLEHSCSLLPNCSLELPLDGIYLYMTDGIKSGHVTLKKQLIFLIIRILVCVKQEQ